MPKSEKPRRKSQQFRGLAELSAQDRFDFIHEEIRRRICLLIYPPGKRLSETKLAAEFGLSRTPIRSVLAQLEAEGLVESQQGSATRVTQIELSALKDEYDLRMRLAELVGEMGVNPATPDEIEHLRRLCRELEAMRAAPTQLEYDRINLEFHRVFLARIRNRSLQLLTDRMYFRTSRIWLSNLPLIDWDGEIEKFKHHIELMIDMLRINDDRGIGLLQRHIIYTSLIRVTQYRAE